MSDTQELAFAARFDREEREVSSKVPNVNNSGLNVNLLAPGTFNPGPINPALGANPGGIPDRDNDFEQFQPKVTWRWDAAEGLNIYASYGVGFRSGGFNSLGTADLLNFWFNEGYGGPGEAVGAGLGISDDYDKEVSETFELGAKQALGQGLAIAIEDHRLCLQRLAAVKQHAARPSVAHHNSAAMCAIANAGTLGLRLLGQNLGQGMHAPANRPYASLFNMRNQHQGGGR